MLGESRIQLRIQCLFAMYSGIESKFSPHHVCLRFKRMREEGTDFKIYLYLVCLKYGFHKNEKGRRADSNGHYGPVWLQKSSRRITVSVCHAISFPSPRLVRRRQKILMIIWLPRKSYVSCFFGFVPREEEKPRNHCSYSDSVGNAFNLTSPQVS